MQLQTTADLFEFEFQTLPDAQLQQWKNKIIMSTLELGSFCIH